ncbi:dihydroorotase family protein [Pigmentiphaga aceris]|uniref:Dihydroorotase family protein n=1 Tax=Pigmentiphaga aceris TaxID=1940612 RepID=A0A5C0AWQ4_9BURK|nr:dihydroorotase family protein [Pigmentiphaga aceris]QEI06748.1 dihydroorotase family protein [Pigmentiphaga aceris]
MATDFVLRGGVLVDTDSDGQALDLLVQNGRIAARLLPGTPVQEGMPEVSAHGLHVFPGLIDAHIHFGFGEKITEYETETVYAAQGGFTTVLGYFLNNEDYTDVYRREQEYARTRAHVDYGFHFSVANELHVRELPEYVKQYGVTSFKYFMNFKGEEGRYLGLDGTDDGYFYDLLAQAAKLGDVKVVCHTENIEIVNRIRQRFQAEGRDTLRDWSDAKPAFTEAESCVRAMMFAEHLGAQIYIPHLSTRMALNEVRRWRERYEHVYVETCPHYLTHDEDSDLGPLGKANPPFRSKDDIEAMWEGLRDGSIDVVASDHVPRKKATKERTLWLASQGFPGTATILPVLLSEGYHKGRLGLSRIADLLTRRPADIFNLPQKGRLDVGADADLTLVDLQKNRVVRAKELGSYSDYSLYDGWDLKGWPVRTIVRGETVMQDGKITGRPGYGQYLARTMNTDKA